MKILTPKQKKEVIRVCGENYNEEGAELILEYKRKEGSVQGFIDVKRVGEEGAGGVGPGVSDDEIPIVEEEEYETPPNYNKEGEGIPLENPQQE